MNKPPHILIEQMPFGDYRVGVWDENLNSLLNKEYFCRGYPSAFATAMEIKADLFPDLPMYGGDPLPLEP